MDTEVSKRLRLKAAAAATLLDERFWAEPEAESDVVVAGNGEVQEGTTANGTTAKKKRKIVHCSRPRKRPVEDTKPSRLKALKDASSDLSDPSQLTMREIIRRAEAIERKKLREEAAKKTADSSKKGSASNAPAKTGPSWSLTQDTPSSSALTPQVQIIDGRIVINQQSLIVGAQASTREDTESYVRVEENRPKLNYNSYSNRTPTDRWRKEDTELFYKALQQFGTDFELIQNLFPGRTRRQVKAKFKNEEKLHPLRLADVLGNTKQDQSEHYKAIIEMLKPESGEHEDDLLESLIRPTVDSQEASLSENGGAHNEVMDEQAIVSNVPVTDDDAGSLEANFTEKIIEDEAKAEQGREPNSGTLILHVESQPSSAPAAQPEARTSGTADQAEEVVASALKEGAPASKPPRNPLLAYRSSAQAPPSNPLSRYGSKRSPLGAYKL